MWKSLGITVQSSACTACELPCAEKSPWNNSSFLTAVAFPLARTSSWEAYKLPAAAFDVEQLSPSASWLWV